MKALLLAAVFCSFLPLPGQTPAPAAAPAAAASAQEAPAAKPRVQIDTSYGPIVVELEPALAPQTVANFLRYVKEGHYAGTIFHRVMKGFMIQGGGMLPDLTEKPVHASIPNEAAETFAAGLRNTRGTIAMARTDDPNSASAQFFINTVDNVALDHHDLSPSGYGYCAFGRVVSGMEAVDKIEKVNVIMKRGNQNVPEYPVRIKSAEIVPAP